MEVVWESVGDTESEMVFETAPLIDGVGDRVTDFVIEGEEEYDALGEGLAEERGEEDRASLTEVLPDVDRDSVTDVVLVIENVPRGDADTAGVLLPVVLAEAAGVPEVVAEELPVLVDVAEREKNVLEEVAVRVDRMVRDEVPVALGEPVEELVAQVVIVSEGLSEADKDIAPVALTLTLFVTEREIAPVALTLTLFVIERERVPQLEDVGDPELHPLRASVALPEGVPQGVALALRDCVPEPVRDTVEHMVGECVEETQLEMEDDPLALPQVVGVTEGLPEEDSVPEVVWEVETQRESDIVAHNEGVNVVVALPEGVRQCVALALRDCVPEPLRDAVTVTVWEDDVVGQALKDGDELTLGVKVPDCELLPEGEGLPEPVKLRAAVALAVGVVEVERDREGLGV